MVAAGVAEGVEAVVSMVAARVGSRRHRERATLGPVMADVAAMMGLGLHPWQRHVGDVSLELVERVGPGSRLRLGASSVGVVAARQTGKTAWCAARVALQCLLPELDVGGLVGVDGVKSQRVGFTAQDRIGALGRWYEHVEMIMSSPLSGHVSRLTRKNGEECLYFANGSTYRVITPSRTGARGLSLDLAVIDEALAHPAELLAVIRPTMAQRDGALGCIGAQLVIVSNAGDERSTLLNEQRELGRRAAVEGDGSRVWFEWSAGDDADPYDEAVWRATIPTLDQPDGISLEYIRTEAESMRMEDFRREYLCVHTVRPVAQVIDPARWAALPGDEMSPDAEVVLAVDAVPDRTAATVVAAGRVRRGDEALVAVEVVERRPLTDWVVDYVAGLAGRHRVLSVVVDAGGPLASVIGPLQRGGVDVCPLQARQVVDAAAGFCDLVTAGRIAHMRDPRLGEAVAGVGRRKVGDRWAFDRRGGADISPLVAASLAVWAVEADAGADPRIHWAPVRR